MKTLYIECRMGAAGDMLNGALSELVDQNAYLEKMNSISLEDIEFKAEPAVKCGVHGTHMSVLISGEEETTEDVHSHDHHHHDHEHEHTHDHEHEHDHDHEHEHDHEHHHDNDNEHHHHHHHYS
ncbi:MAG TPA: TIGR00299 family protein, partial [Erysipelotrichaceae bacterium]|nr:TIGR00299 family protein [Erysipelotrichaceae bacterium]